MKTKIIGVSVLAVIMLVAIIIVITIQSRPPEIPVVTLKGFAGGEKIPLLNNATFKEILYTDYHLNLDISRSGSLDMVQKDKVNTENCDFLWPSSQVALELFREDQPNRNFKSEIVFNSPIVIYSWDIVVDGLMEHGIVSKKDNAYYIIDMPKLVDLILEKKQWSDIDIDLYGRIFVQSTDPLKSNSGNMFYGLLANVINGQVVSNEQELNAILPKLKEFYDIAGYMEDSSSVLFEQYLRQGLGSKNLVVGYENQMIEFSKENPDIWNEKKDEIVVLYPVPTVWSSHPIMSLNNDANPLIEAMRDKRIQDLAWTEHGFRTGIGIVTDNLGLNIPEKIDMIVDMPKSRVMIRLMEELGK